MINDLHWGGINGKSLFKTLIRDIWTVFAVMIISYFGLGIAGSMSYTPSYTSNADIAVYPFNRMYTLETSSNALGTVSAVNEVFNSEMFRTGLRERLGAPADFSLYSRQIDGTCILMLSVSSSSPENAYQILRTSLDYYGEISSHLVGDSQLEILSEPEFPSSASNYSKILKRRSLLTVFMGIAMTGFLVLMYAMRKTFKTSSAIQRYYRNVRFYKVKASIDKHRRRNKSKSGIVPNPEAVKKTALELWQMLRTKNANTIFVTSAVPGEGEMDITVSLARELAAFGKSVVILETDSENTEIQERVDIESTSAEIPEQSIKVLYADKNNTLDVFFDMEKEVEKILEQAKKNADVIFIDGGVWTRSKDEQNWKEAADTSLAVCRQDKADFYAIDQMMTDLQENDPDLLGCVLYGF